MKRYKNVNLQKLIVLEGFMQNGHYHRNQRIFLRIKYCDKIVCGYLLEKKMTQMLEKKIPIILDNYFKNKK